MLDKLLEAGKFKARILDPEPVVDEIFKQIKSGNSGQVFLPGSFSIAAGLRGWPSWIQKAVRSSQRDVLAS